jgi:hypothetical protein
MHTWKEKRGEAEETESVKGREGRGKAGVKGGRQCKTAEGVGGGGEGEAKQNIRYMKHTTTHRNRKDKTNEYTKLKKKAG